MFRNQYDSDVTIWSPQGRLHQVEYAMEAVKQGSASVGLVSDTFAILASLRRRPSQLAGYQEKTFVIDDHIGISISGLTADARYLCKFMRGECVEHRYVYDSALQTGDLVEDVARKHHECTQFYVRRPFGVGLLVVGYDKSGTHLYQTCPSGDFWEYKAMAIGARSQSAKTYLEKNFESFPGLGREEMIRHAIQALNACCADDEALTVENASIGVVGKGEDFHVLTQSEVAPYLEGVERRVPAGRGAGAPTHVAADEAAPPLGAGEGAMDTE